MRVAATFPSGVPGRLQSVSVSLQPLSETESFPKDSEIATTSLSTHSSSLEAEFQGTKEVTRKPGAGESIEPSTENGFGPASSGVSVRFWQNDSPSKYLTFARSIMDI